MSELYEFDEQNHYSKIGIQRSIAYLNAMESTVKVINVENMDCYRDRDVDLVWVGFSPEKGTRVEEIEVKTDSYTTGNFWLEVISNDKTNSEGCFLKSTAKWYFYYFEKIDTLYIINLYVAKDWLRENLDQFKSSKTSTKDRATGQVLYNTLGKIVPIKDLEKGIALKNERLYKIEKVSRFDFKSH